MTTSSSNDPKAPTSQGTWIEEAPEQARDADFPHSPPLWSKVEASEIAQRECLELDSDHWEGLRALQEYYSKHEFGGFNVRELHDALDEKFHEKGGYRFLYRLFPGGPIAQGCRLAGLEPPSGAVDLGFGSVV